MISHLFKRQKKTGTNKTLQALDFNLFSFFFFLFFFVFPFRFKQTMTITTLLLEKYDVSPITGFLPSKPPLKRLSNEYFAPWENMMDDFNDLLLAGKLREKIHKVIIMIDEQEDS
jgi:hypothetical protein